MNWRTFLVAALLVKTMNVSKTYVSEQGNMQMLWRKMRIPGRNFVPTILAAKIIMSMIDRKN
jgi:hypothetical protein